MAINPETQYPGKITASSANYPYGQARNITVPGDGTGTPWEAALVNDIFGMQQALLSEAGITPTGNPETAVASQYLNAMHTLNPRVFDTYDTDLAAYTPLGDEQVVYVKGKASVGDGGAGLFYYDLASTTWLPLFGYTNSQGLKNKIINGAFDLWDYATSQTSDGYGSDNRWVNQQVGSTKTHSQQAFTTGQTDVPGEPKFFSRTVVVTSSASTDYIRKQQRIEDVRTFAGGTATLSFYAKADASKDIAVEFHQDFGTTGSPSSIVEEIGVTTVSLTTSWAKYTVTVSIPSISGKTLGTDENSTLRVNFWFDAGSDFNANTNSLGNQSGTFDLSQVQLEEGPVATAFEKRTFEIEKSLCRPYLYKWARVEDGGIGESVFGFWAGTQGARTFLPPHAQYMRVLPTAIQVGTGSLNCTYQEVSQTDADLLLANTAIRWTLSVSPATIGEGLLITPLSGNYILFDSEL